MKSKPIVVPSLLAADFSHLGDDVRRVTTAGASVLHLDIMDGHFVPNISFGPGMVRSVEGMTERTLDTHLMITNPGDYLETFRNAGSDIVTVHAEVCPDIVSVVAKIKALGMRAGVCVNPESPVELLDPVLPSADLVLIMSVHPGFGGQKFIESSLEKLRTVRDKKEQRGYQYIIEVDGGIDADTIGPAVSAGAEYCVAGNAVFGNGNIEDNYRLLTERISTSNG